MNISYENNNILSLVGKITEVPSYSHSVLGEGFFESKIEVQRLSGEVDILPITFSERLIGNLSVGDQIAIKGQFRSYNKLEGDHSKLMLTVFVRELLDASLVDVTNNITLVGYICKEPIYRTTPFGREIADILLAVNRAYNKSDYLPCIAWGRNARFVKDLSIGEKLEITGRVQSRNYQKRTENDVVTKTAYEISISSIMVADGEEEKNYFDVVDEQTAEPIVRKNIAQV